MISMAGKPLCECIGQSPRLGKIALRHLLLNLCDGFVYSCVLFHVAIPRRKARLHHPSVLLHEVMLRVSREKLEARGHLLVGSYLQ